MLIYLLVIILEQILFLLTGTDHYLIKKKTDELLTRFNIDRMDLESYDMEETLLQDAIDNAMTIPFLSEKKAVVLTNASFMSAVKPAKELEHDFLRLEDYSKNPNPTTVLIILAPYEKLDSRKKNIKLILDHFEVISCNPDKNKDVFQEVKDVLAKNLLKIDANALQVFVSRAGSDREMLFNELEKLINYAYGYDTITVAMIKEVVYKNPEDHIYQLVNAVIEDDKQMMIAIYRELLEANIDPMWMIGAIISKFQEILYTKELIRMNYKYEDIMHYFSASKGRTYYIMKNANQITKNQLEYFLTKLEDLDSQIKTGQIDKQIGLELFILRMYL